MATTTNYGWTTPDDTALVKDGAAAIRTLGSSVDTSVKSLNPGTTSGDLDYYTSATAKARIGIGTNGQVLSVSGGVPAWAAAPSSIPATATATVATAQTTTSTSYTNLTTSGPAVTITTGTKALVIVSANFAPDSQDAKAYMDFDVSGATTRSASDTTSLMTYGEGQAYTGQKYAIPIRASVANLITLTAGSNTFTAKYRVTGNTGQWSDRTIFVMNLA